MTATQPPPDFRPPPRLADRPGNRATGPVGAVPLRGACVALLSAGAVLSGAGPAAAQPSNPAELARGVTVLTRPRPAYDPLGVRLPGFRLDAAIDLGGGYDDNTAPNSGSDKSSAFLEEQITLNLTSTQTRHAFGLNASQATRRYFGDDDYGWNDYSLDAFARYDIGRASSVGVAYGRSRNHIEITSFEVQQGALTRPLRYDVETFRANGVAALNRVSLTGALESSSFSFQEQSDPGFRGGSAAANDYTRLTGEAGASYAFLPGRSVMLTTRLSEITYDRADQRGRDSFTWEVLAGARYDITSLVYASFGIGYRRREFDDPALRNISGPAFEGQLVLLPSQLLSLTIGAQRTIEESLRSSNVSYVLTSGRFQADYELRRNVILSGELRAEQLEYKEPDATARQGVATVTMRWLLNRNASVIASYRHVRSLDAPAGFQEFDRNLFHLRLRLAI
ncbi:outer membrane beta-barrel protein [Falsiroseomonas tokyonensis]|uniref:Outer membrane beta-barrel protein n=1 Tax=Falsiroseomonas tokyonensis TaxID=430521 RepID=A0ABV7C2I0_9PROT|nr:outer membrane beta-barrel protein [Falsiroseomonas tokyonensis]MBU8541455.1 outer membrane beta-barrel protein [Falsiroseomonas tokyonensis]